MVFRVSLKKYFKILLITVVVVLLLWWGVIHPLFAHSKDYTGLSYYKDGAYLKFDDGKAFQKLLKGFDGIDKGQAIDFYHRDNYNNPLYGKMPDIYVLTVQMQPQDYLNEREKIASQAYLCEALDDYLICGVGNEEAKNFNAVGFCDTDLRIRYIMATNDTRDQPRSRVLIRNSGLQWKAETVVKNSSDYQITTEEGICPCLNVNVSYPVLVSETKDYSGVNYQVRQKVDAIIEEHMAKAVKSPKTPIAYTLLTYTVNAQTEQLFAFEFECDIYQGEDDKYTFVVSLPLCFALEQ